MGDFDIDDALSDEPLSRLKILYYGVGHMLNDVTAACWFTYLLLFLTDIGLSPRDSATVMLSGQIADGFATIFAGELIDRLGHFKAWHGAGSILVALSFSTVFGGCFPCNVSGSLSSTMRTVSYCTSAAVFNIGWAAAQVSHMSMLNCLSLNSSTRVMMASCRNTFTMVANLSLYAIAFFVFSEMDGGSFADVEYQYRCIAYVSICFGCCFVAIFHLGIKEPSLIKEDHRAGGTSKISWSYWFKKTLYYQVCLIYTLTRLVQNVSQAYLAYYIIDDLQISHSAKALVPAIIYVSSFVVSVLMQELTWNAKLLKIYYTVGGVIWIFCGVAILLLPTNLSAFLYAISVCIGIANAFMSVTAVSMQSVLIGSDLNGCAFVCGSFSFADKISCGIGLYVLQSLQHVNLQTAGSVLSVTRVGLGLVPTVCSTLAVGITYFTRLQTTPALPLMVPLFE